MRRGTPAYTWTLLGLATVIVAAVLRQMGASPWFIATFVALVALCGLQSLGARLLFRHRLQTLRRALEAEDLAGAESALAKITRTVKAPKQAMVFALVGASMPLLDGRFAEARARLAAIDVEALPPMLRPVRDNDLAWAMAHDGAAAEALVLAERAVATARPEAGAELPAAALSTLGVVQLKVGRAAESRSTLERALALGGPPRMIATRAFYLGEALRELGERDEAAVSYHRALEASPDGMYAKKAQAALATLAAERPYRG